MENKLRRGLALLMTLIMLISCAPMDALAAIVPVSGGTQTSSGVSLKSIVKPPVATVTYVFMNGTTEFARQILKNGETLNNPGTPEADSVKKEFVGWLADDGSAPAFGKVTVTETTETTYRAQFADVYFVFFTNPDGEVMVTKKGNNGDAITTDGVTYPVGNEQSIVGWEDASSNLVSSVTLNGSDVTLTARVENGHWITYDSQGGTYVAPAFVKGNGMTTAPENPTRPGYTFHHWSATVGGAAFDFGQQLDQALTLYAVWTPNANTQYTVIHWWQNANDDGYTYHESETKTGKTGEMTEAEGKTYNVNGTNVLGQSVSDRVFTAQTIQQQTIAGDGSTIVNVYYSRKSYTITFRASNWSGYTTLKTLTKKWGETLKASDWHTYNGDNNYKINGSSRMIAFLSTMPMNGATLNAIGDNGRTNTATYYGEALSSSQSGAIQVSGRWFTVHHTDTTKGTSSYTVGDEDRYPIDGFTLISNMGTQVGDSYYNAKFYYSRNSYNVVYINNGVEKNTASYRYEASIADAGNYELTDADAPAGKEGYVFAGWYDAPEGGNEFIFTGKTMPAQNVTVYAHWAEPTVIGKAYITIDGTGNVTTLENVTYGGTITDQLNALQETIMKDKPGYTWRGWRTGPNGTGDPFNVDTKIYSNITLYPYYTKDGTFTVEYVSGKNDVTAPVDGKSYAEDSFADLKSPGNLVADDGEYFLGWSDGAATYQPRDKYQIKSNHANEQNVITLTAKWGARPGDATLIYKSNDGTNREVSETCANNATITTKGKDTFTRTGYTLTGWNTASDGEGDAFGLGEKVLLDNSGENVLYAIWTAKTDVSYTVHYYKQGTTDKVVADKVVTGKTFDSTVTEKAIVVTGYTAVAPTEQELKLDAYNKEIIFYYTVNQYGYTIEYYFDDVLQKDLTVTGTAAYESTINYEDKCPAGYVLDKTIPDAENLPLTIRTDESANVIKVYYKKNVFTLTINYVYEDGSEAAGTHTENVEFGKGYSVTSPDVVGYTPDKLTVTGTMPASNVEVTVTYTKRSDLSYTVYYYWNGTTTPVDNSKTVDKQIYNATVTESPATIGGYTAVSDETQTITIGTGENKIIFYYYKNVELTANSKLDEIYDGTVKTVSGFTGAPDDADFSAITVGAQGTDAGEYSANFDEGTVGTVDKTEKYKVTVANNGSLTINKRTVTLTSETASKEYDGTPLTKPDVAVTGDGFVAGEVTDVKATGSVTFVHEGEVANTITYTEGEKFNADNYTITKNEGTLTITKREGEGKTITVTAANGEKVYDGAPLTNNGFTFTQSVLVTGDVLTAVVEGSQTDVGSSDNEVKSYKVMRGETEVTSSYTFTESVKGALTVTLRGVTFTGESKSLPYTGGMQSITGIAQSGLVEGHKCEGLAYKAEGQNVGSYGGAFSGDVVIKDAQGNDVTKNYNVTKTPGKLTITNAQFAVTFTGESDTKVYNGEEQPITGITATGLLEGHTYSGLSYEAKGKDVGSYDGVFSGEVKIVDAVGKDVTENYAVTTIPGKLTITAVTDEVVVTITGHKDTVTYDGKEHPVTGYDVSISNELYKKADFTFKGTAEVKGTGANTYPMGLKAEWFTNKNDNFKNVRFVVNDGELVINKRPVKVTAEKLEYAYNYANPVAHPADDVARCTVEAANGDRGLLTGDTLQADVLYDGQSTQTLIGVYQAVAQIAAAKITNADGDVTANYTIEKVDSTLTIKGNDPIDPGKETTSVQTNYTVGDVIEYKITVKNVSKDEATNVVVTDSMAEIQDSAGYTVSDDRHTATIASIPAGGTVLVYARHTVTAEDVENAYAGNASGSLTNVANIAFGDWNKNVEGDHDKLNDTYEYVVRYYWNNYTSVQPHEEKKLTAKVGDEVTEEPAVIEGYTPVSADSRKLIISADQSKNVIEFYYYKNVELTANSETYTYDGKEKQVNGFTIEGENKDQDDQTIAANFSAITVGAKGVDAGEYPANFAENTVGTVDKTGRYIVTAAKSGKLVINPVTGQLITITANSASKTYDGTPLTDNGFSFTQGVLADGDVLTAVVEGSATNVGDEGKNVVKSYVVKRGETDVTKNYTFGNSIDGKLTINKRTVTLTSETASKEYDGTPLTKPDVTVTGQGFVAGEVTGITATGSVTFVDDGEVPNAITYTEGANYKESNYTITKNEGKLSITKRTDIIVITTPTRSRAYNGSKLLDYQCTYTGTIAEGDELIMTFPEDDGLINAGSKPNQYERYRVERKSDGRDVTNNYTFGEPIIGTLTVTPVAIELTAASDSKQYDGTPLTKNDYEISNGAFVGEEGLASVTVVGSQTLVGESANTITAHSLKGNTLVQNYTITYKPGKLTVTRNEKVIKVTANSHTWEYDGQPHSDGGYTVNYDGVDYPVAAGETATLTTGDVVKATVEGIVTNVADSADDNNVVTNVTIANRAGDTVNDQYKTITRVNGGLKITKRGDSEDEDKKVKIIAEPNTVGYDGSAHGAKLNAKDEIELGTSYTTARLVDGHYVDETTLDITGSQTSVGVYENELKPAVKEGAERIVIRDKDDNDVTDNYALTLVPATLTITGDKIIPDKKAEDENIESNYNLGDKIEFTITVKNVSIYDVENVIVTDANAEIQAGDGYTVSADKHTATIAIIAAKSEIRIKALHTVTSEDILAGKVGNEANVKWKDGETTVGDDTTKLTPPNVTLNVTKTSDWEGKATGAKLKLGTKITYTITVKNAGNVPYTNVNFTDLLQNGDASVTGDIKPCETLPVNGEYSFTSEYIVTEADLLKESINNKVTAEADEIEYTYYEGKTEKTGKAKPKGEAEVTDNTDAASASFTSTKTTTSTPKNEKGYALGETITYEIKVTNDGNLTLTDVEVTEKLTGAVIKASRDYTVSGSVATIAELKPGQTVIVNVEYVVTEADILAGSVKNVATVTGKGPDDKNPDPDKPGTEDPTDEPKATLEIVKAVEGDPENGTSYALGEKITYTLTVKVGADNNVTVKDIRVTDTLLTAENVNAKIVEIAGGYTLNATGEIELPDMAPGADDVVITYTYTVQESDLGSGKYGSVHNAATVKGTTPEQGPENPNPKPDDPKDDANIDTPTNIRLIITAKDNLGIEYDGDAHGENGYDATGLATGHKITNVTISGSQTNVGRYENELVPDAAKIEDADGKDVTSHYEIKYVRGTLEIIQSQKALKVVANSNSWTYDDAEHSDGGYTVTYGEESYTVNAGDSAKLSTGDKVTAVITKQVKNVSDTAAGNNEIVTLTVENESQYASIIQEAGTLTITQRPVKITVNSKTFTYDAAEHTVADEHGKEYAIETAAENSGLLPGHTESLNVVYDDGTTKTESRKYVGTYTADSERDENGKAVVTITKEDSGEDVTANYAIVVIPGELEIKKAEALIKIVGPDSERVYNGQKQVVRTTDITTDPDYAPSEEEPDKIKILVTGLIPDDYIEIGTVIHVAEGTYVGKYEGNFEWDGLHKDEKIPTVLNDGIDVTQNYRFEYAKGWLTIKSNQPGEHPTKPDKEIDGHEPGTKYALGDRIYFTITVRNITNSDLKNVHVSDPTAVIVPGDGYTVVDEHHAKIENMPASVDGQEPTTVIINAYHVVTEDDIKNIVIDSGYKYENVATITVGDKTIDASKGTNDIEDADYTLKIEKQLINRPASGEKFKLGETAKFQITVTNEGNVTQTDIPVAEKLPGAVFTEGDGYTLNADKTVATITKVLNPADKETQHGDSIILYAQYTITENDLGNTGLKNIVAAPNGNPGEEPIPVDEAKSVSGRKIWNDLENRYNTRTESITISLMRSLGRGGAAELIRTVTVTQNSGWRYSFDHLPAHDMQDNEYFYWVEEEPITGYETVYEMSDDSHCDIVNNLQTYTLTIHYWQHKLGDTKMEQAFPDYVATLYYKQPYDVESPEREGIILDDMSQARISGTMPAHDLVIDVYYHRIAYRLTIHYIYQDGTMAHEDYTWTYWFNSTYNVPSPIIPGFTPSIDVIAGRMPSHGLELTVVYVGDGEIVIPDEDTSLGFKSYLNAGECFE